MIMPFKQSLGAYEQRKLGQLVSISQFSLATSIITFASLFYFFTSAGQLLVSISNDVKSINTNLFSTYAEVNRIKKLIEDLPQEVRKAMDYSSMAKDLEAVRYFNSEMRDMLASVPGTQATIEATILLMKQQFTNLLTRLGPIETDISDILISLGEVSSSTGATATLVEEINGQLTEVDALLTTSNEILTTIEAKMPLGTLIERLNREVHGIEVVNLDFAQIDLDLCEYDPLGIGPINCEGLESEAGTLQGVTFTAV